MRVTGFEIVPADPANKVSLDTHVMGDNKFLVKQIQGLDAGEIMRNFYSRSKTSGKKYYNLSLTQREIVAVMALNPRFGLGESYSEMRDEVYRLIASSRTGSVDIKFLSRDDGGVDHTAAVLTGSVTKVESSLFEEKQTVSVTIDCDYPLLAAPDRVITPPESITTPGSLVITDDISTAPHGLVLNVTFSDGPAYFEIKDPGGAWSFRVTPPHGFNDGDELILSSEYNQKKVYLVRGSNLIGLADVVKGGSIWPLIFPGENHFTVFPSTHMTYTYLGHYPTYWGV